jgi:methoxymalonate biosynthesis acyl carrier protein
MKNEIREFLARHIKDTDVQDSDDIFALGLVDSLFAMQLVLFAEQAFDIEVTGDDLDMANFRTINGVAALVKRKQMAVAA